MTTEDKKLLKEAKKLPWEDRLLHQNWKVRNDANIDLTALCDSITDPKDPRIREIGHFFKKTVADSNAQVQDKALDALIAYLKAADADAARYAKEVCDAVVAKCLTGRPKTAEKAQMVFTLWVELEAVDVFLAANGGPVRRSAASMLSGKRPVSAAPAAKNVPGPAKPAVNKKTDGPSQNKKVEPEDVEPAEMTLEEIESRLGYLIQEDNITQLTSAAWKERLEGICERVADIKTRAQAMKCLTTFSEAVGPGFIFERMSKIMKEHKNPKVLSEGLLWMVSAVDDFGVAHLKLKDVIDLCKDTGLQSSAAATRNATIKLIGALHKFVGPDIKAFLSDVKPALLSAVEAECEKNPFEGVAAAPKKTVKASDSVSSVSGGGLDSLPREDISGKITPELLKGLESSDWKVRLESIEAVNKIVEEANKRIQPTGTVELFGALRARLCDNNRRLIMAALTSISGLASAMGPAIEKSSKGILSDIVKCIGDNKKHIRECTLATLDSWVAATHLDKMVPYISASMTDAKLGAEGRKDLFDWLSKQLTGLVEFPDAIQLLRPVAVAMTDKSADVLKAAEVCFGDIVRVCGPQMVIKNVRDIQGPALAIFLERLKSHGAFPEVHDNARTTGTGPTVKTTSKIGKPNGSKPGSRAVSSRGVSAKGSKAESIMSVQDINIQSQALLNVKDSNKDERERIVVRRFKFEELRLEQVHDLENDLMRYFREDLHRRLLSTDFKKQIDGIEMLQRALPTTVKEIIEVLDILLKWFVLRFCESNTSCLLKVLEFLPELFDTLRNENYIMNESEASIFLPSLVEKTGHNIKKLREKLRELLKQIILNYSAAKTLPYILEGLRSRNNRTRIECADLVGFLLDNHSAEVYGLPTCQCHVSDLVGFLLDNHSAEINGQLRSLAMVASLTAERDGDLRKAALNCLATGYKILGDDIWKNVGKLTEAQRSMLDEKLKWKAREIDKRREGKRGEARAALRRSVRENGSDIAEQSGEVSRSISGPMGSRLAFAPAEPQRGRHPMARPSAGVIGPTNWNEALEIITYGSPEQSVEGMKVVCQEFEAISKDPEIHLVDDLIRDADRLVSCLAAKVAKTFDISLMGASRSCKYVLKTLMQAFQNKRFAHAVNQRSLDNLITELLLWLVDERFPRMDDGSQLLTALNDLMVKVLDNAERTSSFVVLISLLKPIDPSRWPSPPSNESFATRNMKFSDLVMSFLIKLTKVLQSTIYEVDLDRILHCIHVYLEELGMDEIRRRTGAEDKPLRMVKTVLHELVKLCGTAIQGHLSMVPIYMEPQPIILAYIDLNLQTLAAARMLTPIGPTGQTHWDDSMANNPMPAAHSADAQLKQELAAIFKKIGDKQTWSIGLYELYGITQLYPKVDIYSQLQNASEAFQTYIRDGLAQMENNIAAGRTPSCVPMPTPPPSALNLPSPNYKKQGSGVVPFDELLKQLEAEFKSEVSEDDHVYDGDADQDFNEDDYVYDGDADQDFYEDLYEVPFDELLKQLEAEYESEVSEDDYVYDGDADQDFYEDLYGESEKEDFYENFYNGESDSDKENFYDGEEEGVDGANGEEGVPELIQRQRLFVVLSTNYDLQQQQTESRRGGV